MSGLPHLASLGRRWHQPNGEVRNIVAPAGSGVTGRAAWYDAYQSSGRDLMPTSSPAAIIRPQRPTRNRECVHGDIRSMSHLLKMAKPGRRGRESRSLLRGWDTYSTGIGETSLS